MFKNIIVTFMLISFAGAGFASSLKEKELIGLWRIKSFIIINNKGIAHQWAEQVHGTLFYSKDHFMSVSLNGKSGQLNKILQGYAVDPTTHYM